LDEWEAIWPECWRRIRSWRVPPRWNRLDWWDEARAEAALAACAAALDYDPTLGVPRAAFLYQRILAGVWTRYRQEWAYGRHLRSPLPVKDWPAPAAPISPAGDPEEVARLLGQLGARDRWLIRQLFWAETTETGVAAILGISHQAVSQCKHHALKNLRRVTGQFS
jgi:DNA-directed RNA polymerase specialized sigma24 family protein